jgi:putative flippase GtrA
MFLRFLVVGGSGFLIDAGLTQLLLVLGIEPWLARIPAILTAMTFTWLANRQFTYRVETSRSVREAGRYALVAVFTALINYALYILFVTMGLWPVAAVALATAVQTVLSFHGYRLFVFRRL